MIFADNVQLDNTKSETRIPKSEIVEMDLPLLTASSFCRPAAFVDCCSAAAASVPYLGKPLSQDPSAVGLGHQISERTRPR